MTTFMNTMRGLLKGETVEVDEEGILPGVQQMMRQMGLNGWLSYTGLHLPVVVQDLVHQGFATDSFKANPPTHIVRLTDKGKAYIGRIGGPVNRTKPITLTVSVETKPRKPDQPA